MHVKIKIGIRSAEKNDLAYGFELPALPETEDRNSF